jgi:hypothetical protein
MSLITCLDEFGQGSNEHYTKNSFIADQTYDGHERGQN